MRLLVLLLLALLFSCAQRPSVGITISNTPGPIESCGAKIGRC